MISVMWTHTTRFNVRPLRFFAMVLVLAGCAPHVGIQGVVYNIEGEPLPGVSVRVEEIGAFAVSNGNGVFGKRPNTLSLPPGTWELAYFKTGFTTARQTIDTGSARSVEAAPVQLWPLPSAKGIYVLDGLTYLPFTRVTPDRHRRENNAPVYGMKLAPELKLATAPPMIISHRLANYDWQLTRLEQVTVLREGFEPLPPGQESKKGDDTRTEVIWAASVRLPIQTTPIDEPEQQLWRIIPSVELGPGLYAIHWGALDGDPGTEPSAYLMEVIDPNAAPQPEEAEMNINVVDDEATDDENSVPDEAPGPQKPATPNTKTQ